MVCRKRARHNIIFNPGKRQLIYHFTKRTPADIIHNSSRVSFLDDLCYQFCCIFLFLYYNIIIISVFYLHPVLSAVYIVTLCCRDILCNV